MTVDRDLLRRVFLCNPDEADRVFGIKELFKDFDIEIFQEQIKKALKEEGFEIVVEPLQEEEFVLAQSLQQKHQVLCSRIEMQQIQPC